MLLPKGLLVTKKNVEHCGLKGCWEMFCNNKKKYCCQKLTYTTKKKLITINYILFVKITLLFFMKIYSNQKYCCKKLLFFPIKLVVANNVVRNP